MYSDTHNLPHLSDLYYQPASAAVGPQRPASRSSTLTSIKRMLGLSPGETEVLGHPPATSPLPQFMQFVPAPPQFLSPGAISNDSLMLMSPDYSAVYHPLIAPPLNQTLDVYQPRNSGNSQVAESSFSSSSSSLSSEGFPNNFFGGPDIC